MKVTRNFLLFVLMFIFVMIGSTFIFAQEGDDAAAECDAAAATEDLSELAAGLADAEDFNTALRDLRDRASDYIVSCGELTFSHETDGTSPVIGPIDFPDGAYRVTFDTNYIGGWSISDLDGDCGFGAYGSVTNIEGGQEQAFTEFEGCRGVIEVNATKEWSLTFELIQ